MGARMLLGSELPRRWAPSPPHGALQEALQSRGGAARSAHMTISFLVVSRDRYSTQLFLSS